MPAGGTMRGWGTLVAVEPSFVLLSMLLIFLSSVEVLTIMLSLARVAITQGTAITIALGALLITAGYRIFLRSERLREIPDDEKGPGWSVGILVFLAMLVYVWLWIIAYALPDFSWDGLFYHGPTMHFWARKGYIHWIKIGSSSLQDPIDILWNGLPKGVELIGFIMVRATGLPRLLNAINLPFLMLGVLAVISLSRTLGASILWAWMAGALYIFIPINISLSVTTYIDPGVASCYLALFALVGIVLARIKDGLLPWRILPALGCGLGLSLAAKAPGIVLLPTVAILLALRIFRVRRTMPSPDTGSPRSGNSSGVKPPTISSLRLFGKGGGIYFNYACHSVPCWRILADQELSSDRKPGISSECFCCRHGDIKGGPNAFSSS